MFELFTDRSRRVVVLAQEEASALKHGYIGTEHLLLGLLQEGESVAFQALTNLGVDKASVLSYLKTTKDAGIKASGGHIPFSPHAQDVLKKAVNLARDLSSNVISPEHLLLGILTVPEGRANSFFTTLGIDANKARDAIVSIYKSHLPPS